MPLQPLCFILMPFGQKADPTGGRPIDFDRVYQHALEPAVRAAGMTPIRADEERTGGIIHKPMFERLLFCEYAVADLTTANANVFYELGVRHTARPSTTLAVFANHQPVPFDVNFLRALPYELGVDNAFDRTQADALCEMVTKRLIALRELSREGAVDSPLYQLLGSWQPGQLAHEKTDVFRDQVRYSETVKARLAAAREKGKHQASRDNARAELAEIRTELGDLDGVDTGVLIDLMLSFRALENWDAMIALYEAMRDDLKRQILIQEQLAFAINRRAGQLADLGERDAERGRALQILTEVEKRNGANPETCGLIGRIHKDRWREAVAADPLLARSYLNQAIDAYRRGFYADTRDYYPGINVLTLLEVKGDGKALREKEQLLPVVRFAVQRQLAKKTPSYWDYATLLELAVLDNDQDQAMEQLIATLGHVRERWEPKSTAQNLRLIQQVRQQRGMDTSWLTAVIERLER